MTRRLAATFTLVMGCAGPAGDVTMARPDPASLAAAAEAAEESLVVSPSEIRLSSGAGEWLLGPLAVSGAGISCGGDVEDDDD